MATRKPAKVAAEIAPAIIAIPEVNMKSLGQIMSFADKERRSAAAANEAERALSALVRTADEIAAQAGDIATDAHSGSPIERERHAKKINKVVVALEKVRLSVAELAAA